MAIIFFLDSKVMLKQLIDPEEPVLFSAEVQKLTRWNFTQARTLILTTEHFYLFEGQKISRTHNLR